MSGRDLPYLYMLPTITFNALCRELGYGFTVDQVAAMSPDKILSLPCVGSHGLRAVRAWLSANGRKLSLSSKEQSAELRNETAEVRKKIVERLDWRGPNGSKSRYVVLDRADAAKLIGYDDSKA